MLCIARLHHEERVLSLSSRRIARKNVFIQPYFLVAFLAGDLLCGKSVCGGSLISRRISFV